MQKINKLESELKHKNINLDNTPGLFNKKSKKIISKPSLYIKSDTATTRHFTPASQEWFNNIYSYNHNYIKSLPSADKSLMSLLKTYFNSLIKPNLLISKVTPTKKFSRKRKLLKNRPIKVRRMSTKRVFVGKGELKHTNNKIILTFYTYSTHGMVLSHTYKWLSQGLFYPRNNLKKTITWSRVGNKITTYSRIFSLYEYIELREHYYWYMRYITSLITKVNDYLSLINTYYEDLTDLVEINVLTENEKYLMFNDKVESFSVLTYPNYSVYLNKVESNYKREWYKYMYLLNTYKLKFTSKYLSKLNVLVNNIYNKKVVFNIVNLKKMHLNSDIFTQAVALKLRNKNNKLFRVLKSSLRKINIKPISKIDERRRGKRDNKVLLVNRIRNNQIISMLNQKNADCSLEDLIRDFYPSGSSVFALNKRKNLKFVYTFERHFLNRLKHMRLRGIRVEAKGRLTRRATASRSVFKMRWKGGLKNIESSFRGWSAIMLRGIVKSNVQYSVTSSKNPNGAYGVKGWVSNK
jgi:hypothetical protein